MVHTLAAPGGPPWRQKKTGPWFLEPPGTHKARRPATQGAPRDPQGAKTIVFDLIPTAPGALLWKTRRFGKSSKNNGNITVFAWSTPIWIAKCDVQVPPWTLLSRAHVPQDLPERSCGPNMLPQDPPRASCGPNMNPQDTPKAPPDAPEHPSGPLKSKRSTCLKLQNGAL